MGKLRVLSGQDVCAILLRHGFLPVRQRSAGGRTTTVPVPDHKEVKIGTLRSIIRQSGIARSEFE